MNAGPYLDAALSEVIENAIIHAESDTPHVTVTTIDDASDTVIVSVRDDGPGIPDQDREIILGDRSPTQLDHASGLGLWLVRWILDAYGGTVDIRQPTDGGSDVRLQIPAA